MLCSLWLYHLIMDPLSCPQYSVQILICLLIEKLGKMQWDYVNKVMTIYSITDIFFPWGTNVLERKNQHLSHFKLKALKIIISILIRSP